MLSAERKLKIAELVNRNGGIKTSELSSMFNVSEMTVLRDLAELEKQGVLKRVYGGAVSLRDNYHEVSSSLREKIHTFEKNTIAQIAVELIQEGESIFLDGSTTSLALARRLYSFSDLTVVTNGLDIINEIRRNANIKLICPGGEFNTIPMCFLGPGTENFLRNINLDKAFISSAGISIKAGLTEPNPMQASVKRIVIENSSEVILLVDRSKFGKVTLNRVCDWENIDIVVTDGKPEDEYVSFWHDRNIKVLY